MCFFCWLGMCKWGFKVIYNILHLVFSDSNDIIIWFTTILSLKVYDDSQIPSHSNQFFFNLWNPDKFNLSDKICFRRKISGFFPQKRINLGLFKTPVTEVSLASLWWTTSRATRWWGLEAFGAPRGFPRPQKTWGGLVQPLVMMMDHENLRCIYITPTKVLSKFGQKLQCDLFITTGLVP